MYRYEDAVKQLQDSGTISLMNFKELPYEDLEELLEEIKKWCVYANGNKEKLEKKYADHELAGDYVGYRECHIENDWLLIYKINKKEIIFCRTGTHSDLFR